MEAEDAMRLVYIRVDDGGATSDEFDASEVEANFEHYRRFWAPGKVERLVEWAKHAEPGDWIEHPMGWLFAVAGKASP